MPNFAGSAAGASANGALRPPSEKQLAFIKRLGHEGAVPTDGRAASQLIDKLLKDQGETPRDRGAWKKEAAAEPPTDKQLGLLNRLGYFGDVRNKLHATHLIDEIQYDPTSPAAQATGGQEEPKGDNAGF